MGNIVLWQNIVLDYGELMLKAVFFLFWYMSESVYPGSEGQIASNRVQT